MRTFASLFFIALCTFLSFQFGVHASESCPGIGSPEDTANKYKLFTAYQTGYDGYEATCELKCFGNESCQNRCQSKEGLRLLEQKLHDIVAQNNFMKCPSYTLSCLEQCKKLGISCAAVCGREMPVANNPSKKQKKN